ncbi:hypothetical protein HPB48_021967 [Haemaphysalis longicornis]|uniref:Uncharacterized protein n=1 Tax=Haemaphysalis longicornis TaxID=44386 RepID=A0A9J6G905_HAELO|nr:hypothetical protein HPB48_021967 [Haemaphysalis longicornis]
MTDNSAAERAALQATWPEAARLLCHFHAAQAEWRWLQASRNKVSQYERRELTKAFQKAHLLTALDKYSYRWPVIMYAASAADLEAAIEQLHEMSHKEYVQ